MRLSCARLAFLTVFMAFGYLAHAADPQGYKIDFASTGDGDMDATLKATSDLQSLRTSAPVSPFGLIARGRSDIDRFTTVLESYGYYQSGVTIKINGMALKDPELRDALSELPKGTDARVDVSFTLGPLYHLRKIDIDGELPDSARATLGLKPGDAAVASAVLAGESRLLSALQEQGYAFAKVDPPVAYEAADAPVLDLSFHVVTGARVNIGEIHIEGQHRTHESLLRRMLLLQTGDPYKPSVIERGRKDLLALGVFGQVSVQVGAAVDGTGGVPITYRVRERRRHAVALNAAYSSDLGGSGGVTWTDRNLLGNAEQLKVSASVLGLGGSDTNGIGYDTSVTFIKPDFLERDQSLQVSIRAFDQSLEAYDQKAETAAVTVTRKLSSVWRASVGLSAIDERIIQQVGVMTVDETVTNPDGSMQIVQKTVPKEATYYYTLIALPLVVSYDSTNLASPLEDPLHGLRGSVSVTPTLAIGHPDSQFVIIQVNVATFFDLDHILPTDPGRSVIAARALAGTAKGAGQYSLPPDQRFYAGGSSTIRGYKYQSVGPQFPGTTDPIGGTEIEAGSVELRQRIVGNYGAVAFVDGGRVAPGTVGEPNDFRIGVGVGVRYYTPIGPIRFDIAAPTKRRSGDDSYEIYIGLGQAY